jgi:hypothetical protein
MGNRAMTCYEFAAGLNAALDRVNELIAAGLADAVSRKDLATLQRLQENGNCCKPAKPHWRTGVYWRWLYETMLVG